MSGGVVLTSPPSRGLIAVALLPLQDVMMASRCARRNRVAAATGTDPRSMARGAARERLVNGTEWTGPASCKKSRQAGRNLRGAFVPRVIQACRRCAACSCDREWVVLVGDARGACRIYCPSTLSRQTDIIDIEARRQPSEHTRTEDTHAGYRMRIQHLVVCTRTLPGLFARLCHQSMHTAHEPLSKPLIAL